MDATPAGPAPHPPAVPAWRWLWRYVVASGALAVLGVRYFGDDAVFPPLAMVELGLHESSHLAMSWGPRVPYFLAGSVGQVLVPLLIGAYLLVRMRDPLGGAVCLGWAGLSCHGVAVYVADAPTEALPLVGGDTHDWAYLLGPEAFDALGSAAALAGAISLAGAVTVAAAVAWCLAMPVLHHRGLVPVAPRPGPSGTGDPGAWRAGVHREP
jgi:hypothetical protein